MQDSTNKHYNFPKLNVENLIEKIIYFKNENNENLIAKFTLASLISIIEKDKMGEMEKLFKEYPHKGVDIIDFVRIFLNLIEHLENETIYLVMSLVDFFRAISEELNMAASVKYTDVTDYVCDVIIIFIFVKKYKSFFNCI